MSELLPSGRSEGYGACDDEVNVGDNAEIANIGLFGHKCITSIGKSTRGPAKRGGAQRRNFKSKLGSPKTVCSFWGEEPQRSE